MEEQTFNPLDMIDPRQAFALLQEYHGMEMSRLAGDIATKNAFILMLQRELQAAQERITALEQNQQEAKAKMKEGNGARQSGADLSKMEMKPAPPASLKLNKDNPRA